MLTLNQIAEITEGQLCGDGSLEITSVETLLGAREGDLTFAVDDKLIAQLPKCRASAVLVAKEVENCPIDHIKCDDVKAAFIAIAKKLRPVQPRTFTGISPQAYVSPKASIGENVTIYPGAFIGDRTAIGDNTTIYPNVCILEDCTVGCDVQIFPNAVLYERSSVADRTIIHAGAIIGAFGFGYDSSAEGHKLSVQLGKVEIGEDVDIGAGTTIDRGTFGTTRVGQGTKIDNQVMIGHNCQIGQHNLLCSQVGIAGSSKTNGFVVMAGQVGVGDHLEIGEGAIICAQSGVMRDREAGQTYLGSPSMVARDFFQMYAAQTKLPEIRKQLKTLTKQVKRLEVAANDGQQSDDQKAA